MVRTSTAKKAASANVTGASILVVEDNDSARRMVNDLLRAIGFNRLLQARTGEEAIALIEGHNPDILLVDWGLPGMSGLELVSQIRQAAVMEDKRFPNPKVPVVMLTARQRSLDVADARNAGVDEFVVKPFSTTSLLRAVQAVLLNPRPFIIAAGYVGPCRRRKPDTAYDGPMRRTDDIERAADAEFRDMFQRSLSVELESLRALMQARGGLHKQTLRYMVSQLLEKERKALEYRLTLVARATHSLNDYMQEFGDDADTKVLDVHLEAIIRLNGLQADETEEARKIIRQLDNLVARRKKNRRLSA
ncbi:MAG: response regulator [Asticcacaulis sp.]